MTKSMKRIHQVTIITKQDDYNGEDTIGTFDNEPKSEYAIELTEYLRGYRYEGYKFYNAPVENYKGLDAEEIRKYVQQDYERMQSYNAGEWDYVGVFARATMQLVENGPIQVLTSGGLWGVESDCEEYVNNEVAKDELADLRGQLHAIGFSQRVISAAFKNVKVSQ